MPFAAVAMLVLLAASASAAEPASLGPCGPIGRRHEAVELSGAALRLQRTPVGRVGVVAFQGGVPRPIPFQLDEKRGRKLALPDGPEATADDRPGVIDVDDVLVFLPCDAGEHAEPAALERAFPPPASAREIRLEDPGDHAVAWAYAIVADEPPATDRRYVDYDATLDFVTTAGYRVGLVNALPSYLALSLGAPPGPNLLDGLRLRADATLKANLMHWSLNEQQGRHELIAWKVGPVRVVRRSRHHVVVGLGIQLSAGTAHTYFYPEHIYGPGSMKLPFSPGILFREIKAMGGADGRGLEGWRYVAVGTPNGGFRIDGRMDAAERRFAAVAPWFVLAGGRQAILFFTRTSENLAKVVPLHLAYRDDAEHPLPPERVPGTVPLVGYEGRGVERLPGGRYTFAINVLMLGGYRPGDERGVLSQLGAPLLATVSDSRPIP